jgi:hypothetical protein
MVLIFVVPGGRRPTATALQPTAESTGVEIADLSHSLRIDRADALEHHQRAAGRSPYATPEELTDARDSGSGSPDAVTPKLRRGQSRARKLARTAGERAPESPPVTWIQVGPGKFIRVEGGAPAAETIRVQEITVGVSLEIDASVPAPPETTAPAETLVVASLETDSPEPAPPVTTAPAEALVAASLETDSPAPAPPVTTAPAETVAAHEPPDTPVAAPGDVGMVFVSEDPAAGTALEEYGIAPSAFDPNPVATSSVAHPDDAVPRVAVNSGSSADRGGGTSRLRVDSGHSDLQWPSSNGRVVLLSRGIAAAIPRVAGARLEPDVPAGWMCRSSTWSKPAPEARLRQTARRAFGQIAHFQRTHLPRSPPDGHGFGFGPALPDGSCRDCHVVVPGRWDQPDDEFSIPNQRSPRRALHLISRSRRRLQSNQGQPADHERTPNSQDQHRVTVAEEAIAHLNRVRIGSTSEVKAGKRADQDEQGAAGQVKIRDERVEATENMSRPDKELDLTEERSPGSTNC